jgi:hypothetical protein
MTQLRTELRWGLGMLVAVGLLGIAGGAYGQGPDPGDSTSGVEPRTFGTATEVVLTLSAWNFTPSQATQTWSLNAGVYRFCSGGNCQFISGVQLPAGAIVTRVQLDACDNSSTNEVAMFMTRSVAPNVSLDIPVPQFGTGAAATPGCVLRDADIVDFTVNNATEHLNVYVNLAGAGSLTRFASVRLFYRLQVSPAPSVATFSDVPTSHPFFQFVEALARSGITSGCGSGNFCPDAPLTRGQMAVFLSLGLGLHFAP